MYYVYILENNDGELYFGFTSDLKGRLSEHNAGRSQSTKNHKWKLIYYEAYAASGDARRRERQIKLHGQAKRQLRDRVKESRRKQS